MQEYPHQYVVKAAATTSSNVSLSGKNLPQIESAAPAEFGGPGDRWSPETLLVAAVADCFLLSFKAIARASKVDWKQIECVVQGTLDRVDRKTLFTGFILKVEVHVPETVDTRKVQRLLEKAESACLITNSMHAGTELISEVHVVV